MATFQMKKTLFLIFILGALLSCQKEKLHISKITAKTVLVDATLVSDSIFTAVIVPFKEKMITEVNTVISYTPKNLVRTDGNMQSTLGNLLADLCYKRANPIFKKETGKNIDFAMFNYGGIRAGINKGNVSNKHAFELMPFENTLVAVELSGEKIIELLTYFISNKRAHPLSKQLQLIIYPDNSYSLSIHNKKFDKTKNYVVLTTDYLQSGGDHMTFFKNPISIVKTDYKMRHAIMDEFKSLDTIYAKIDNRIIVK